ncbi:hypothetical protein J3459_010632 [Metarhizium acridum]|uniref:Uncharacterized protein n=1 Tax=Metarhizium acridum (strain CQMa 102) TaxID=655827 RepID=E9E3D8_METAQ|nr:uncharacterized protein MAC_04386 [Metarhizium acridum CQMa 102]EFY89531.1 hypothetical protein MAC_04386 [Metarhizium acridum CQMa 102]KAG8422144.1 hypothetical protein J3459_010632 [Metarhizium acridum]
MLRRKSSRSTYRRPLGRSKSTSSIARRRADFVVNIDAASAERDAHIAANLSYYRAHGHHRQDTPGEWPSQGSHNLLLRRSNTVNGRLEGPPNGIPKRKQSVRFTGPNARPRRQLAARAKPVVRSNPSKGPTYATGRRDNGRLSPTTSNYTQSMESNYKPRTSNSSVIQTSGYFLTEPANLTPMPPFLGSLRKSKSMYSQSAGSVSGYDNDHVRADGLKPLPTTPLTIQFQDRQNQTKRYSIRRSLRAPKSMSYLEFQTTKPLAGGAENKHNGYSSPEQVMHSKGSFRHLKSHSSMFFRSKHRQQESSTGLSRSLRNSSDNSAALFPPFPGHSIPPAKHTGIRFTARRVSRKVRNKLSRLFGRSKSTDTSGNDIAVDPSQDTDGDSFHRRNDTPPIEEASMSRVTSHVPSLHAVPSYQQMRSRQGSLESISHEENIPADDKSRVTSWTNSSANTVMNFGANEEHEYQRLSVIKENGMHIPSSSRIPLANPTVPGMTINSQRVYSALMKKLTNTPNNPDEVQNRESTRQSSAESVPLGQSPGDHGNSQPWSPPIIRCIGTSDDDVFEDTKEVISSDLSEAGQDLKTRESFRNMPRKPAYKAYPNASAGDGKGLSPAKIPLPESATKQSSIRADRKSTFSPSSDNHLFRTTSPYRRAIQQSMKDYQESDHTHALDTRYLSTLSALSLPSRRPSTVGSERDVRLTYAESFYSFTTEELTTARPDGLASPPLRNVRNAVAGDVTVPVESFANIETPVRGHDISAASSVEWKAWLSANMSKLEKPHAVVNSQCEEQPSSAVPLAGHMRESAEIESPGETPKTAATGTGEELPGRVVSSHALGARPSPPTRTGSPLKPTEGTAGPNKRDRVQHSASPSVPSSPLRHTPCSTTSLTKVDNDNTPNSSDCRPGLLRMRSVNTVPTPAPQSHDGLPWKRCDQENSRSGPPIMPRATPGLSAIPQRAASGKGSSPGKLGTGASTSPRTPEGSMPVSNSPLETTKSEWDAQIRGSRRMVDLFLSSRRKAIHGTTSRNGSESFSTAFL